MFFLFSAPVEDSYSAGPYPYGVLDLAYRNKPKKHFFKKKLFMASSNMGDILHITSYFYLQVITPKFLLNQKNFRKASL